MSIVLAAFNVQSKALHLDVQYSSDPFNGFSTHLGNTHAMEEESAFINLQ